MMASHMLSRLLPSAEDASTTYAPNARRNRTSNNMVDPEAHALDEQNLEERFHDQDVEHLLADAASETTASESATFLPSGKARSQAPTRPSRPRRMYPSANRKPSRDEDDDVPESLLLDGDKPSPPKSKAHKQSASAPRRLPSPVPGPSNHNTREQWHAARAQQRLHDEDYGPGHLPKGRRQQTQLNRTGAFVTDPKEKAMWRWANVHNLDSYIQSVYMYFMGHGVWAILLARVLSLLKAAFIAIFCTFLLFCVDYKKLSMDGTKSLQEVIIPGAIKNIHGFWLFVLWVLACFWFYRLLRMIIDARQLFDMHDFYHYLLDIPDKDIQTVSWQLVIERLMSLRDSHFATAETISAQYRRTAGAQSKQSMDAHDIANRIMRKENYLIALYNKDVLDLTVPFLPNDFFSKTMEYAVHFCVIEYVFSPDGHINLAVLESRNRAHLITQLNRRFKMAAILSVILAPFSVVYFIVTYFFRYFSEYRKDPSQLSSRMFTPMAEWKFREFNELEHVFQRRRNMSYPFADSYLQQFPKYKMDQLYNFVAFIAGALISVLVLASVVHQNLMKLEIVSGQSVLVWLGILSAAFAFTRNTVHEDTLVLDPEYALGQVINCTHYLPVAWRNKLHTDEVRKEFSDLYQMKIVIFLYEILSMVLVPFVLWSSLPRCSARIVDFFREFTIHVDGLGHVCSFAVFEFKKGAENVVKQSDQDANNLRRDYFETKNNKLDHSILGFYQEYGVNPSDRAAHQGQFNPPPAMNPLDRSMFNSTVVPSRYPAGRHASKAARVASMIPSHSPMQSVLLDPHHQPPASTFRKSPLQAAQTRYRSSRHRLTNPDELEEEAEAGKDESNLGDSWLQNASSGNADDNDAELKDAGVLGLLHQFQKAQTEGRVPGV
ncbi:autophagy protein Apg9 [Saccharata proteae CBS 121410]|uniref:Autophagy-related protein 9 n=1 Tax=Saccharata proteae CBS 121410 TaxID=1314787 RepID=A0A9P4HNG0_9PEZI|nr:autophagy protein Apg9 [Saccharata proteae CBS 121410]